MDQHAFDAFFKGYAKNVDQADQQFFWRLSDAIVEEVIRKNIPETLSAEATILDAGAGTGRWIIKLARRYPCLFVLYDLSADMLDVARDNIGQAGLTDRVRIQQGSLTDMSALSNESVDHLVSTYNPISFVDDPARAMSELFRVLKPGGVAIVMGQGYHNAIASKINNSQAPAEELAALTATAVVQWGPHVPPLHVFSKETLEGLMRDVGFATVASVGIPVFIQPGPEDFDSQNRERSKVSRALESDPGFFQAVFDAEMAANAEPNIVNRGMNIFAIGRKR